MPQIIKPLETGLLVEPKDEKELAKAIEKLVNDNELREQIGNNCRKFVEEKYSWKSISDETESIYNLYVNKNNYKRND